MYRIAAGTAAALLLVTVALLLNTTGEAKAAAGVLGKSMPMMGKVRTMVMQFETRTPEKDNFGAIDLDADMVPHTMQVIMGEPAVWRLDKAGRSLVCDGKNQYQWISGSSKGFVGGLQAGFGEPLDMFAAPYSILAVEKAMAEKNKAKYKITETSTETLMTVKARAKGDFLNDYTLNSSIEESDSRREYVFDKSTDLLKSVKVFVKSRGREVLVAETISIKYDLELDPGVITALPGDVVWHDVRIPVTSETFASVSAKEAARMILEAMGEDRFEDIAVPLVYFDVAKLRDKYAGIKLLALRDPFRSGQYPGVFVPCRIMMPDGTVEEFNLAIRNDNVNKVWLLDGGI